MAYGIKETGTDMYEVCTRRGNEERRTLMKRNAK